MQKTAVKILENIDPSDFDALAGHPMQSYAWGEARRQTGVRVVRIGKYSGGTLIAVYQMTVHKIPKLPFFLGYVPRSGMPGAEVVSFLHEWARAEKIIFIKWEPYIPADIGDKAMGALERMVPSSHPLFTRWNQELDLSPSEEELLARCHSKTRYSIRLAERKGVEIREMSTDEGFKIFSDLYFATCARQNYHGHTRRYQEIIWKAMGSAGVARIFIAFYEGRALAAYEIFFWHDRIYYPYGGTGDTDRNIPAAQLLMWRIIQAGKASGASVFDMWGSLAPDYAKKHPWNGFTFFKRGFSTRFVQMSASYDLVSKPALYCLYSIGYGIRKFFFRQGIF